MSHRNPKMLFLKVRCVRYMVQPPSSCELGLPATGQLVWHWREGFALSLCIWLLMVLAVNEKHLALTSTSLLVSCDLCSHIVWGQFDTTEAIPRVLWTGQKSGRTAKVIKPHLLWGKHSSAVVQDMTPTFYNKISFVSGSNMKGTTVMLLQFLLR